MWVRFEIYGHEHLIIWKFSALHGLYTSAIWGLQNITCNHKSRNAKTSSYDFLFKLYSPQCSIDVSMNTEAFVFALFTFCIDFLFNSPFFAKVFTSFWFDKAKTTASHLFSNLVLVGFSITTSPLHSITYWIYAFTIIIQSVKVYFAETIIYNTPAFPVHKLSSLLREIRVFNKIWSRRMVEE